MRLSTEFVYWVIRALAYGTYGDYGKYGSAGLRDSAMASFGQNTGEEEIDLPQAQLVIMGIWVKYIVVLDTSKSNATSIACST